MNVYTVTFLNHNYGSVLQAFALQSKLREFGANSVILQRNLQIKKWRPSVIRFLKILKPQKHYSFYERIKLEFQKKDYIEKNNKIDAFIQEKLIVRWINKPEDIISEFKNEDILLAGSDQIWNILNGPVPDWFFFRWNALSKDIKKYSYAASIGITKLTEEQKLFYRDRLSTFTTVSLREEQAVEELQPSFVNKLRCDLDPTLLYERAFWQSISSERKVNKPYIFVYMLRPNIEIIDMAKAIAKEKSCEIVYTGLLSDKFSGVTTVCDAGVEDFISYIKNADMILTNSFHGTVFSILFQKNFLSVKLASTSSRVENLLNKLGLTERIICSKNELYKLGHTIDYVSALALLEKEREKSLEYIKNIVSC